MFEVVKKQIFRMGVTGIAAAAVASGGVAFAQQASTTGPQVQARYITDPAQIEAILAECGLSSKALPKKSGKAAAAPPAPAASADAAAKPGEPAPIKRRCNIRTAE